MVPIIVVVTMMMIVRYGVVVRMHTHTHYTGCSRSFQSVQTELWRQTFDGDHLDDVSVMCGYSECSVIIFSLIIFIVNNHNNIRSVSYETELLLVIDRLMLSPSPTSNQKCSSSFPL